MEKKTSRGASIRGSSGLGNLLMLGEPGCPLLQPQMALCEAARALQRLQAAPEAQQAACTCSWQGREWRHQPCPHLQGGPREQEAAAVGCHPLRGTAPFLGQVEYRSHLCKC